MDTAECETNTVLLSDVANITFRIYDVPAELSTAATNAVLTREQELRDQNHLVYCDWKGRQFWAFKLGAKDDKAEDAPELSLQTWLPVAGQSLVMSDEGVFEPLSLQRLRLGQPLQSQSQHTLTGSATNNPHDISHKSAHPQTPMTLAQGQTSDNGNVPKYQPRRIYKALISAILKAIIPPFCRETGALPLNYRTVLFPRSRDLNQSQDDTLVTGAFRAYLTTAGALVISLSLNECHGLASSTGQPLSGSTIYAAPFGVIANFPGILDAASSSAAQTPNPMSSGLKGASSRPESPWRKACLRILGQMGISTEHIAEAPWLNLLIQKQPKSESGNGASPLLSSTVTVPWPGPLCFRKKPIRYLAKDRVEEEAINGYDEQNHDPLGEAGNWFASLGQREDKIAKRKAHHNAAAAKDAAMDVRTQVPNSFRRPSGAASAGNMYLTPPDALQNPNGVTPSADLSLSSPNTVPSATVAASTDGAQEQPELADEAMIDSYDFAEPRREHNGSNVLGDPDADTDMFGDMGGDMFVENDVTDADFNFFDEDLDGNDTTSPSNSLRPINSTLPAEQPRQSQARTAQAKPVKSETIHEPPEPNKADESAVFTKPELRHARSSQADYASVKASETRPVSVKRESSPFDPQSVYKRVRASLMNERRALDGRNRALPQKEKSFQRVDFDATVPLISKKYQKGGQFDYGGKAKLDKTEIGTIQIPVTDYLKRYSKGDSSARRPIGLEVAGLTSGLTKLDAQLSKDGGTSTESDQDEADDAVGLPGSPAKSDIKGFQAEDDNVSQVTSLRDAEPIQEPDQQVALELPQFGQSEQREASFWRQFADYEPLGQDLPQTDDQYVQVAQLVTEQAATGHLKISRRKDGSATEPARIGRYSNASKARSVLPVLQEVVAEALGVVSTPHTKALLELQDALMPGQPARLQPRPVPGRENQEPLRPNSIYQIPGPHLEVGRAERKMSVLPSAVGFWESLGLSPSSSGKDVRAACVFPRWTGVMDNAWTFLSRMKSVYESLKLGSFETLGSSDNPSQDDVSLFSYALDRISTPPSATLTTHGAAILDQMDVLKWRLSEEDPTDVNVVVFIVYPLDQPGVIVEACTAFQSLFDSYRQSLGNKRPQVDLVMQLVSEDLISSPDSLVVTPLNDLSALCFELYDRCTVFEGQMPAPAIKLEQNLPRMIDFKLTSAPSASLMHENSCIHVSYAQSVDDRWITAAWTDDRGNQQATAAYCLGRHGGILTNTVEEVAAEMWKSTLELISVWKVHWRIIITKCSPMEQHEIDCWSKLAKEETKAVIILILMTVDTNPSLQLIPPCAKLTPSIASLCTTPVSTPQASIVSPEQTANTPVTPMRDSAGMAAQTPTDPTGTGAEPENIDTSLIDVTDQTWGAVLGHRLSNTTSILEVVPTLASGYLIKRTGIMAEDPPVLMEVNLVHTEATPRAFEALFREMLSHFRALGTLARARGVTDQEGDVRPWHVAVAEKANKALYLLM